MFCNANVKLPKDMQSILDSFPKEAQYKPQGNMILSKIVEAVAAGDFHITVRDRMAQNLSESTMAEILNSVSQSSQVLSGEGTYTCACLFMCDVRC